MKKVQERGKVELKVGSTSSKRQIPGYLPVEVKNYSFKEDDVKFFGVTEKGNRPSGRGVNADLVREIADKEELEAWFNIDDLIKQDQFTEETVECVLMVENEEVGRQKFPHFTNMYLG